MRDKQPRRQSTTSLVSSRHHRRRAVSPESSGCSETNVLEIRPGRWLNVQHLRTKKKGVEMVELCYQTQPPCTTPDTGTHSDSQPRISQTSIVVNTKSFPGTKECSSEISCQTNTHSGNHRSAPNPQISCNKDGGFDSQQSDQDHDIQCGSSNASDTSQRHINTNYKDSMHYAVTPAQQDSMGSQTSLTSLIEEPGTVLFFLHGVGGCGDVWYHQVRYFHQAGFEVVVPDMLGHGFSRAPKRTSAYTFAELAEDMLAVFDSYAKKRNVLIGHSYGGSFCALIARKRPRKVTKLILISNGGPIPLSPPPCQLFCLPACFLACLKPVIYRTFARQAFHRASQHSANDLHRAFDVPSYVLRATMNGQYWPEGDETYHSSLSVGVLIIYGCDDEFVTQQETLLMQETIYASQLEMIDSAGHMVMVEQPERVNELIHNFILKDMTVRRPRVSQGVQGPRVGAASPSPAQRHKTVPNITIASLQAQ